MEARRAVNWAIAAFVVGIFVLGWVGNSFLKAIYHGEVGFVVWLGGIGVGLLGGLVVIGYFATRGEG